MERVDVVIVGEGTAAWSAAAAAARGGVRTILLDRRWGERSGALVRLKASELAELGIPPGRAERTHNKLVASPKGHADLGGHRLEHAIRRDVLADHLAQRAEAERVGVVDGHGEIELVFELDGWRVSPRAGEPVRAPVLLLAEAARAPLLESIGVGEVQRMSRSGAEIATHLVATWELPPSEMQKHNAIQVLEGRGPLGRIEVLPGRDRVTVAMGPIWAGLAIDEGPWPSVHHPAARFAIERTARLLGLPASPTSVELDEWRLDALPSPPSFDGGLVVGAGAGQRRRDPLGAEADAFILGRAAGHAAAQAVLAETLRAKSIGALLGEAYAGVVAAINAEICYEAQGLRYHRATPPLDGVGRPRARH